MFKHIEKFTALVTFCPVTGCHFWLGNLDRYGYGRFRVGLKKVKAHRFIFELAVGPIPEGLVINHTCRVRSCVNPAHLEAVTIKENTLAPGSLSITKKNKDKVCCPRCSSSYTLDSSGERYCRSCAGRRQRRKF